MTLTERIAFLESLVSAYQEMADKLIETIRKLKAQQSLPTAADLDAVAQEQEIRERTSHAS